MQRLISNKRRMRKATDEGEEIELLKEQIAELENEKFICTKSITASHVNAYIDKVVRMLAKRKRKPINDAILSMTSG